MPWPSASSAASEHGGANSSRILNGGKEQPVVGKPLSSVSSSQIAGRCDRISQATIRDAPPSAPIRWTRSTLFCRVTDRISAGAMKQNAVDRASATVAVRATTLTLLYLSAHLPVAGSKRWL